MKQKSCETFSQYLLEVCAPREKASHVTNQNWNIGLFMSTKSNINGSYLLCFIFCRYNNSKENKVKEIYVQFLILVAF